MFFWTKESAQFGATGNPFLSSSIPKWRKTPNTMEQRSKSTVTQTNEKRMKRKNTSPRRVRLALACSSRTQCWCCHKRMQRKTKEKKLRQKHKQTNDRMNGDSIESRITFTLAPVMDMNDAHVCVSHSLSAAICSPFRLAHFRFCFSWRLESCRQQMHFIPFHVIVTFTLFSCGAWRLRFCHFI